MQMTEFYGFNSVISWGDNSSGALGHGDKDRRVIVKPRRCSALEGLGPVKIALGPAHACVVTGHHTLFVSGENEDGRLGKSDLNRRNIPRLSYSLVDVPVSSVACGLNHTLVCSANGGVFAFGSNSAGQLGIGSLDSSAQPTPVDAFKGKMALAVAAANCVSLVALAEGGIYSFGEGAFGLLGNGNRTQEYRDHYRLRPEPVERLEGQLFHAVCLGQQHALGLASNGQLFAWGTSIEARGTGASEDDDDVFASRVSFVDEGAVESTDVLDPIVSIAAGAYHSAALSAAGDLFTWGRNYHGQLGLGKGQSSCRRPSRLAQLSPVAEVACGSLHTLVRRVDGTIYSFGFGGKHQLGISEEKKSLDRGPDVRTAGDENVFSPQRVHLPFLRPVVSIAAGGHSSCVVLGSMGRSFKQKTLVGDESSAPASASASPSSLSVFCGTFNVNGQRPSNKAVSNWLIHEQDGNQTADIVCIGLQELVSLSASNVAKSTAKSTAKSKSESFRNKLKDAGLAAAGTKDQLSPAAREWNVSIQHALEARGNCLFTPIATKELIGVYVAVYIKRDLFDFVDQVSTDKMACGIGGKLGNKGACAIRFRIARSRSLCFVSAHLGAGEGVEKCERRCVDYTAVVNSLSFSLENDDDGLFHPSSAASLHSTNFSSVRTIFDHDALVFMGDFNFRLQTESNAEGVVQMINECQNGDFSTLHEWDELIKQQRQGRIFLGFSEAEKRFPPTYKYHIDSDEYDLHRLPAYCDRILHRGCLQQCSYTRDEQMRMSDHRAVSARFALPLVSFEEPSTAADLFFKEGSQKALSKFGRSIKGKIASSSASASSSSTSKGSVPSLEERNASSLVARAKSFNGMMVSLTRIRDKKKR